ncbi:hypothetical protein LOTGIDRAFT_171725 [Lottia gigantea]|uniref:PDZ domain-containing protein n=1 Tax=Lottia gigantea TaxID=225164 RepID=V4BAX2_LOTGI|nr:hypothetical protein LOTGIDRAFT_171725 [Lottia gigantea]ESP03122.1 hypothetical protein LOTGIDRAFT_171725 [Lottia gigantea]
MGQKNSTLRVKLKESKYSEYSPKTVVLQRRPEGYGFVLRGARSQSHSASLEFQPTAEFPALQYLDSVDPGSQSDRAGLKTGDFILEINGENVVKATHERVVQLIRTSKESLIMKVVTARPVEKSSDWFTHQDGSMTLPNRKKQAPQPPRRNPDTSLSYSKATSKSMAEGLAEIEKLDQTLAEFDLSGNRRNSLTVNEISSEQKTASVRGSHAMKRLSCVDINHIVVGDHVEPADPTYDTPHKSKDYMSPAELRIRKYHKKQNGIMERSKSTPDLAVPDEVVYASTNLPGSGTTLYDRSAVTRTQKIYQKPGSPGHYRQGHMADVKRPMSQMNPDRLKTSVYAGPVVIRSNSEESDPPSIPGRVPVPAPKKPAPTPPGKSEVVSISTSRNDNVYANVSAEIQARKKEKEESPYESSFRPGTLARLTNQPKVTTASLEQAKLKSHSRSSSYGVMSLPQDEETSDKNVSFADDKTMTNAASFIQKHPNAQLLVTADVHQKKDKKVYYEPEPDYDDSDEDKRSSNTTKLQVPANISRQSSVSSSGSKNASEDTRKDVRPKSTSVTVIAVGDTTMKRKSPVTERHFAIHSDIPSTKKSTPQSQSGEAKIMIPPRPNEPAPHPPTVISNHYSGHRSSSSPNSSNSSRRSSVQSSQSGGKDSYDGSPMNQAPVTFPKPQIQESVHHTPPPQAPPPPPPPPAAPPVPSTLPTTPSFQESQMRSPPKQETPQISASDIMNAVKLRQSRIETEGPRMVETTPSQPPPPKTPIDMNQLALKAAVEARKQRLKQENDTAVVDQIESRLHKTKKLQSAKYFFSSDTIKNENKNTETEQKSETPEKTPTAKKTQAPPPPNVKPKSPQVAPKTKAPATPLKTEVKSSPVPKPISSSTPVQKPVSNTVTSQNEANDFLAMAEKARLEILQKKGGGTKSSSVTPIYSSSNISKSKKADSKTPEKPKEDPKLSIKDKIAGFEKQKQEANGVTNGTNIELDGVTEDHSHTEAGNTLTRNGNSAYSPFVAPPPGFGDTNTMNLEIIPPPISFSNDASVDSGQGSDHFNSAFGHDDSASLVSSASTLSTLSSEQGEGKSHYEDIIAPPPPGFSDISEYDESDVIPPPPQFSSNDNKPKPLRPYQTKGVDTWLCTDVLDWLESLGMTQYKSSFAKNCIDGPKLLMLGRNDYIQLGVTQVGHRMNLERSIKKVALGKISTAM